jgi:hypothetical protein
MVSEHARLLESSEFCFPNSQTITQNISHEAKNKQKITGTE